MFSFAKSHLNKRDRNVIEFEKDVKSSARLAHQIVIKLHFCNFHRKIFLSLNFALAIALKLIIYFSADILPTHLLPHHRHRTVLFLEEERFSARVDCLESSLSQDLSLSREKCSFTLI